MPPKKTSQLLFTWAEQLLLDSASRIFVGTQYKESHLVGNHDMFKLNLSVEMDNIKSIYEENPLPCGQIHRIHGAIAAVSLEYQALVNEKRLPNYTTITSDVIKQHVTRICQSYPDWPDELKSMDLSAVADVQLDTLKWWLPITSTGEDNNNLGRRQSNWSNKGRPPVTADDNVGGRAPSQNKKCSVDTITNSDNEAANDGDDDEDNKDEYEGKDDNENEEDKDDTTPHKGKGKAQPDIDSPTSNRPRRRQRTNEAGNHVDASDEHDPTDIPVEYYRWFGTDKLRCAQCTKQNLYQCVPQWDTSKPSKACTWCAHRKKSCIPTEKWASMVKLLHASGRQYKEAPVLQASTSEVLPPPPPPAVVTPVVAPPCRGRPPKNVAGPGLHTVPTEMAPPPTPQIAPLINLSTADPIAELTATVTVLRDAVHTLSVQMADHTYGMSQMRTESSDTTHRIRQMERIMLVMCEHGNIDLSNTDLGNITNPSTSAGQRTQYNETHSEGNHDMFEMDLSVEMDYIKSIYEEHPSPCGNTHRIHGAIAAVSLEYQSSVNEKRSPDFTTITSDVIKQHVNRICQSYPDWPDELKSMDLSAVVDKQSDSIKWWLPSYSMAVPNKTWKATCKADSNVGGWALSKNKKCSVDAIINLDNEAANEGDDDEDDEYEYEDEYDNESEEDKDDTTPCKEKGKTQPDIDSPTSNCPRRRQWTNEAGDHIDASDEHDPADIPVEYDCWFGTDKLCCAQCTKQNIFQCVPQWDASKPSKACTWCAHRKKSCIHTDKWTKMVKLLRASGGHYKEGHVPQASTSEVFLPTPPPAIVTPVVVAPHWGRPPKNVAGLHTMPTEMAAAPTPQTALPVNLSTADPIAKLTATVTVL
ncbi:hypothetical protein V8E53_006130 [Lactarius tabidus]